MHPSSTLSKEFLIAYGRDALQILITSLDLYRRGRPEFYRVAALQLRLLLCDTTRQHGQLVNVSLLPRLLPDLCLAPFGPDGAFDTLAPALPLPAWLEQPLPAFIPPGLTIRHLIRWVCDQDGGAHVDPKRLRFEASPTLSGRPQPTAADLILFIGEYIAAVLEIQLAAL
ncbi:MAG: hypothetical protein P4L50_28570 [Anaerolineaceae bacterium]|nr:hypothetical protein [Anaerolineaceae bacterium]